MMEQKGTGMVVRRKWRLLAVGVVLVALLAGCAKSEDDDSVKSTLDSLWTKRLSGCSECHAPNKGQSAGPDMSTQASFLDGLKNKKHADYPSWFIGSDCDGIPFIDPGSPANSLLLAALVLSYSDQIKADNSGCTVTSYGSHEGTNETLDADKDAELISALKNWIADDAKDN